MNRMGDGDRVRAEKEGSLKEEEERPREAKEAERAQQEKEETGYREDENGIPTRISLPSAFPDFPRGADMADKENP